MRRAVVCVSLSLAFAVSAAARAKLADRRIPAQPEVSIAVPVFVDKAIGSLQRALLSARVPFGIEQAPPGSEPSLIGSPPKGGALILSGNSVGQALDAFVTLDPRYRWSETGARVLLRPRTSNGANDFLQKRLESIELRRVTLLEAVGELSKLALTPAHSLMTIHVPGGETKREPLVSISLHDTTLFEALNAIGTAAGGVSWLVTYRASSRTPAHTRIAFVTRDTSYVADPPFDYSFSPTRGKSY